MKPIDREKVLKWLEEERIQCVAKGEWDRANAVEDVITHIERGHFDIDPPVPDIHAEEERDNDMLEVSFSGIEEKLEVALDALEELRHADDEEAIHIIRQTIQAIKGEGSR